MSGTGRGLERRHTAGIRWCIFLCLALFSVLIVMTLWFFQIKMLAYFYEREKYDELENVAEDMIAHIEADHFDERVALTAKEKNICICVYRIRDSAATAVAAKVGAGQTDSVKTTASRNAKTLFFIKTPLCHAKCRFIYCK